MRGILQTGRHIIFKVSLDTLWVGLLLRMACVFHMFYSVSNFTIV